MVLKYEVIPLFNNLVEESDFFSDFFGGNELALRSYL